MPVAILYPSGAGTYAEWTPSAGALADALASSGGADARTQTQGARVRLAMDNLPGSAATVASVMSFALMGSEEDDHEARHVLRLAASESLGAPFTPLSGGYSPFSASFPLAPDGAAWTVAKVNAIEWGLDAVTIASGFILADQGWLAVDYAESVTVAPPDPAAEVAFPATTVPEIAFPHSAVCSFPDPADAEIPFPGPCVVRFPDTQAQAIDVTPKSG